MSLILEKLIRMSLAGGILILAVVAVRALLLNRLPKKTFLLLWGVALFRLLIPYTLPSEGSLYTFLGRQESRSDSGTEQSGVTTGRTEPGSGKKTSASGKSRPERQGITGFLRRAEAAVRDEPAFVWIWLAGALCCLLGFGMISVRCIREFETALPEEASQAREWQNAHPLRRKLQIRRTDRIGAPLTYGLCRPVILLPKHMDWTDPETVNFVLEHEWIHIRRLDVLWKSLLTVAVCLHWFNPLVWVLYILMNRDLELACDEAVVRRFGEEKRGAYAMALLRMEEQKSGVVPLGNSFGKNAVEERIGAIMKMKKKSMATGTLAALLVIGMTSVFATSAVPAESETSALEENSAFVQELMDNVDRQIQILEEQRDAKGGDSSGEEKQIEALKEQREQLSLLSDELGTLEELLLEYGAYGLSAHVSLMDEAGSILYLGDRPVRYLVEEEQGVVRWTDEENGEIAVRVIRGEDGGVVTLEEEEEETERETEGESESGPEGQSDGTISIIGGADGPTSIFFAGKLG